MKNIPSIVNDLHEKAMNLADMAFYEQKKGNIYKAKKLFKEAFENEKKAAMYLVNQFEIEPTRSILFRSAASLALDSKAFREAEKMLAYGLTGNPPEEIAKELRDIFLEINNHYFLQAS